jgi:hypothetical protein
MPELVKHYKQREPAEQWIQNQTMAAVNNVTHRKADPETAVFKAAPKQLNSTSEKMEATNNKSGTTTTPQK